MNFSINWYDRLPSTNTFLKELVSLKGPLASGTVIVAREQTHGRGRRLRDWQAAANENLTFSLLFSENVPIGKLPSVTMAAAISVVDLLREEGVKASLKWPNDVLVEGRKICGILSEGIAGGLIIGIGLNINMERADHIDQPATSILIETGTRRSIETTLDKLLKHLSVRLGQWLQGGFPAIREDWEKNVPNIGKAVTVRDGDNRRSGILRGFGDNGELLLEENGSISPVWAGDVSV